MKRNYRRQQERIYNKMLDSGIKFVYCMSIDNPSLRVLNSRFRAALKYVGLARAMADSIYAQRQAARRST